MGYGLAGAGPDRNRVPRVLADDAVSVHVEARGIAVNGFRVSRDVTFGEEGFIHDALELVGELDPLRGDFGLDDFLLIPSEAEIQVSGRFPLHRDLPTLGGGVGGDRVRIEVVEEIHRLEPAVVRGRKRVGEFGLALALQRPSREFRPEISLVGHHGPGDVFHHIPHRPPNAGEECAKPGRRRGDIILVIPQIEATFEEAQAEALVGAFSPFARHKAAVGIPGGGVRREGVRLGEHEREVCAQGKLPAPVAERMDHDALQRGGSDGLSRRIHFVEAVEINVGLVAGGGGRDDLPGFGISPQNRRSGRPCRVV